MPPPGPFRPGFWRSPLRGPWLTAVLGPVLLVRLGIVAVTGFLSHAACAPDLRGNAVVPTGDDVRGSRVGSATAPAGICLLLLVFLPVIAGKGDAGFRRMSGDSLDGYLGRWLVVSALLFAVSGVVYAVRWRRRA